MQSDFKAKHIKSAKKVLSQDLNIALHDLEHYKEVQKKLLEERTKKPPLWQRISHFFKDFIFFGKRRLQSRTTEAEPSDFKSI
jgi:hypothetical protein